MTTIIAHPSEEQEQSAVVAWLRIKRYLFTSIPNESKRSTGYGAKLKRQGMSSGAPDLIIFSRTKKLESEGYHGIAIEMKAINGKLTPNQKDWLGALSDAGWLTKVAYGAHDAINFLERYGY